MCGLVGVFGRVTTNDEKVFEDLLQVDVLRGPHSTGVALLSRTNLDKSKEPEILKGTLLPQEIIGHKDYKKNTRTLMALMMGHNRFATRGKITPQNAHPFQHGHITLTHNGTIVGLQKFPKHNNFETDSETIAHAISKEGIDEVWSKLTGATALVWWDNQEQSLNFLKNDRRPLMFAYGEDETTVYWASESWMIRSITQRRKVELYKGNRAATVLWPKENTLFTFRYVKKKDSNYQYELKVSSKAVKAASFSSTSYQGSTYNTRAAHRNYMGGYGCPFDNQREDPWSEFDPKAHNNMGQRENKKNKVVPVDPAKRKENEKRFTQFTDKKRRKEKDIDEATFYNNYPHCCLCDQSLEGKYEEAVILTMYEAVCGDCDERATQNNLSLV